jgi:hypothetical protein
MRIFIAELRAGIACAEEGGAVVGMVRVAQPTAFGIVVNSGGAIDVRSMLTPGEQDAFWALCERIEGRMSQVLHPDEEVTDA